MTLSPATASWFPLLTLLTVVFNLKLSAALEFLIIIFVLTLQNDTSSPRLHLAIRQTILAVRQGKNTNSLMDTDEPSAGTASQEVATDRQGGL